MSGADATDWPPTETLAIRAQPLFEWFRRRACVDNAALERRVFRHEAQRAHLRIRANFDANLDHTPEANGDVVAKSDAPGLDDASLDGVTRKMDSASNDHIVAAFKKVVVTHRQAVDVHSFAEPCAAESEVAGPERCSADPRARDDARKMDRRAVPSPSHEDEVLKK